jgi:hypothetical protein
MRLFTSGCSFSECISDHIDTWPIHLKNILNPSEHISTASGSQGNGLIARRLIHELSKEKNYDDILVGIMWSGPDRGESFSTDHKKINNLSYQSSSNAFTNPVIFPKESLGGWVIHNHHWKNKWSKNYYKHYDWLEGSIKTFEWIHYTQMFLEMRNIKYFMMCYTSETLRSKNNTNIRHLTEMINWNTFIQPSGCYEWCRDKSRLSMPTRNDNHPSTQQHKAFTEKVIVPWLKLQKYI